MSKALSSYPKSERARIAARRLFPGAPRGLGHWAAVDYAEAIKAGRVNRSNTQEFNA